MLDFLDPVARPGAALLRVAVALLLGGLIGVERERAQGADQLTFAGVRTFPLYAVLGAGITLLSGRIGAAVVAGFVAVAGLVVTSYVTSSRRGELGMTTETAALATYWVGVMAGAGAWVLAGATGIGTAVLLAAKARLEAFPRGLTAKELEATLLLAVIAAVILPILPDAAYGPWGVWNPRALWGMVVLVCGLSFAAFVGMRVWGPGRGLYLSGLLGGLVSSTAVTVSLAARSREAPRHATPLAVAAGLASLVMLVRVGVLAAVAGPAVLPRLAPVLGAAGVAGVAALVWLARRGTQAEEQAPPVTNPFRLGQALRFAALYAVVLLVVEIAARELGAWGVIGAAVLAGLTDVDAITLSLAGLAGAELGPEAAAGAIGVAALSNTVAKAAYAAWLGERRYRRAVLIVLGAAFAAGLAALLVTG